MARAFSARSNALHLFGAIAASGPGERPVEAEGGFVPDLPSVPSQGETVEEALDMARDAIEGYLEVMREEGWPVPTVQRRALAGGFEPPTSRV